MGRTKLQPVGFIQLADGSLLVGDAGGLSAEVTLSGDITMSNTGVTTIGTGKVIDTMLAGSISLSKLVEAVIQADGGQAFTADQDMGGFVLTGLGAPVADNDAARKAYVDSVIAGLVGKESVKAATTAAITLSTDISDGSTLDGILLSTGDRVLVKDQAAASENGIYIVSVGAPTRSTDADTWDELVSALVNAEEGTSNADTRWLCTVDTGGTIDTTDVTWVSFGGGTTDHGTLTGLADDDHSQYILVDGARAFTSTVAGVTPVASTDLTTKAYVDGLTGGFDLGKFICPASSVVVGTAVDFGEKTVPTLTFTFASSTSVTASAAAENYLRVGDYIWNATDDTSAAAQRITAIVGTAITLASSYTGTIGSAKTGGTTGPNTSAFTIAEVTGKLEVFWNGQKLSLSVDGASALESGADYYAGVSNNELKFTFDLVENDVIIVKRFGSSIS